MSRSSECALQQLRKIKPNAGWDVEYMAGSSRLMRLTCRKVPVTDKYFFDIHYDSGSNKVVGICLPVSCMTTNNKAQGQILVDCSTGRLAGTKIDRISVSGYNYVPTLTDAETRDIFLCAIAWAATALFGLSRLIVPAASAYLYLVYTCPSMESFDGKKEIKLIFSGDHLPENHPHKPNGLFSEALARTKASVATELATGPGNEVTMLPLAGAVVLAWARVPVVNMDLYWIGAYHQWWFVYGAKLKNHDWMKDVRLTRVPINPT
jgi:hypothetical protein